MDTPLPRVLITGAGGFLGRRVVDALTGRAEIIPATAGGRRADLLDPAARRALIETTRPEILIHLAWVTEHGEFWSSPLNDDWEAASVDLFRLFLDAGGRRVLGTGSCAEYDWTTRAERLAETGRLAPHTGYGAAKVRTAASLARLAEAAGASWAWGRVFFSFGPGEPAGRLIPLMLNAVRRNAPLGIGPADTVRDFCDVAQMGGALAALALSEVSGPVNIASGHAVRFDELAAIIHGLGDGARPILPGSRALGPGEPRMLVADTGRLVREVGFDAPFSLAEDLARYYASLAGGPAA